MSTRRFGQRAVESQRWQSFHYISDYGDLPISTRRTMPNSNELLLAALEINAACNTTVILARMVRNGRRGTIDPGSKGP